MELTYEEKLELDNNKEHLQIVLVNIRMANQELEEVLEQIDEAQEELNELEILKNKIKEINSEEVRKRFDIQHNSLLLKKQVDYLLSLKADLEKEVTQKEKKLEDVIKKISLSKSQHGIETTNQAEEITRGERKIKSLNEEIGRNEKENKEQLRVKTSITNEIAGLNSKLEEAQKELERFLKDSSVKMEEVTTLIGLEKEKIQNPLANLRFEAEKLEREKKDIAIIKRRLTKQFKEQNPEKVLPIELQEK